jgi:L-ornithine Nalpha-acyltransferase
MPLPLCLGATLSSLEVRLARTQADIRAAQALRFRVFWQERARTLPDTVQTLDSDPYDACCDHLLVLDAGEVVATCRLLRQEKVPPELGFYTAGEYEIRPMLESCASLRFLELGRSCVLGAYRTRRTIEYLWDGIWAYVRQHRIDVMFGCASFEGTDPLPHTAALTLLRHGAPLRSLPQEAIPRALPGRDVFVNENPAEPPDAGRALRALPPLIRGYLRLGASFGPDIVRDEAFQTLDVFVFLPVSAIDPRYIAWFTPEAG